MQAILHSATEGVALLMPRATYVHLLAPDVELLVCDLHVRNSLDPSGMLGHDSVIVHPVLPVHSDLQRLDHQGMYRVTIYVPFIASLSPHSALALISNTFHRSFAHPRPS